MKKSILLPALVAGAIGVGAVYGAAQIYAQGTPGTYPAIVQKIADKFGLNVNDVKSVFDQNRKDQQTQRETKFEQRLTQAVTDGKITDAQKQLIIAKHQELIANRQTFFSSLKNMTPEQRKAAMLKQQQDLQAWAKQNNIDTQYLFGGFGMRGMRGMGRIGWRGQGK